MRYLQYAVLYVTLKIILKYTILSACMWHNRYNHVTNMFKNGHNMQVFTHKFAQFAIYSLQE